MEISKRGMALSRERLDSYWPGSTWDQLTDSSNDREERFWKVDKSIFHPKVRSSLRRLTASVRSIGKIVLFLLLFSYPILLVYTGIQYGGIVFWSMLGGSFIVIGLILSKGGYAGNFQSRNGSLAKGLAGIALALIVMVAFYLGLLNLRVMMIPLSVGILVAAAAFVMARAKFSN
ncbi:MAG: hypothetical protein AUI95_00815 [Crenarchaeota archaeon 13_1_40CM_3_52_4]|nr:MAG: hypothetical protein AUI95_00815 [Crenarchaeota archaeon 13_1_40CM_3_52_4]